MCAVGGLVRRGARSYVWRVTTVPIGQIDVKMFVVNAGGVLNLTTNIVKFYFFINAHVFSVKKLNPAYMGPILKI